MPMRAISYRNRLLSSLDAGDLALLQPHLRLVTLKLRQDLETPDCRIGDIYFLEEGVASVIAVGSNDSRIEIGLIGREGMTGLTVLLGNDRSPNATFTPTTGEAYRIHTEDFRRAVNASRSLQRHFLKYAQIFMVQISQTAIANARSTLEERLSRWLLMAQDRLGQRQIPVTHELLSLMLGVRRAGVTEALNILEGKHKIRASRGQIVILDRKSMEHDPGVLYGLPEAEYRRLIGPTDSRLMWKNSSARREDVLSES